MSNASLYALLTTAVATSLFHTLIPDHWLPFVLIGRARRWSPGNTAAISGFSALLHVVFSALLAWIALLIGSSAAASIGESLERASAVLLVLFGLSYAGWAWHKGGHFHPGGSLLHGGETGACGGDEGHSHPQHLHYHADDHLIRGRPGWGGLALAVIVGVNPCVLLLPLVLAAGGRGGSGLWLVLLAYSVPTVFLMVGLSTLGVARDLPFRVPGVARHMETVSGLLIAALGVLVWWLE